MSNASWETKLQTGEKAYTKAKNGREHDAFWGLKEIYFNNIQKKFEGGIIAYTIEKKIRTKS